MEYRDEPPTWPKINATLGKVCLLLLAAVFTAAAQDLTPAGSIDSALLGPSQLVVAQDDAAVRRYAKARQEEFFRKAELIDDKQAVERSLAGRTLIVYGTPAHAWLNKHKDRLPFRFKEGAVEVGGRRFTGSRLRLICAIRNPEDLKRRALLYVAAKVEDVVGINGVSHGPTDWVVYDGTRLLAAGSFTGGPLSVEESLADLDELATKIRQVHPAAVKGLPPELESAIRQAREELKAPFRRDRLWPVLSRVLHPLRDAHSNLDPPFSAEKLDLPFLWIKEGMIVTRDAGPLRKGDRLVRLGKHGEPQLLDLLRGIVPAENDHWVRHQAESILADLALLRVLGIADQPPVPMTIERNGKEQQVSVPLRAAEKSTSPLPWVRFEIDERHDLGLFVVDQCINNEHYRKTLRDFFAAVRDKEITRVAVDVRRNGGGNSNVINEFLRYIDTESYAVLGGLIRGSADARAQRNWLLPGLTPLPGLRLKNARVEEPFRGQVFILTSKATFSSGNWFALIVQDNKIGQVLGEPTGNAPGSYGDRLNFALTNSGLSYGLSYKHWRRPDPKRDPADCVTPDRIIPTTRMDVMNDIDPVVEHLREGR